MSTKDLIVELGVEEIPAGYFTPAIEFLEERLVRTLKEAHLPFEHFQVWGAPRRLALGLWGLAGHQPDLEEEIVGPPLSAAFDSNGNPTRAATGFASGQGVPVSELKTVSTPKGQYLVVKKSLKGRSAGEILTEALPELLAALPFPKSMRWGTGQHTYVRPVHWLLAVLDGEVLPISFCGVKAGKVSYGHRFLHPGAVVVTSPQEYEIRLAESHVQVDFEKRRELVRQEIERVAREHSVDLRLVADEELVVEVANLLEEPVAVLGNFDSNFLELPLEVAITAMKEHQRYFALTDSKGRLAPYFIAVNNTRARDMNVVRKGHERVLRARLEDAGFYFAADRKVRLDGRIEALKEVVFHHHLGTSWQKVERFKSLALHLADLVGSSLKAKLERAADLCKCDLVSGVVQEFPSLQGLIGREYALMDGEDQAVAEALNASFISIKVDREERPDVDAVYMSATTAMTGSGGWPLTLFMSPDKQPFFAATYLPLTRFCQITGQIAALWKADRPRLMRASQDIMHALRQEPEPQEGAWDAQEAARRAYQALEESYDPQCGGFGRAPKFPGAHTLMFLQRYGLLYEKEQALDMARFTLERMSLGGIHDQIGGGFCRYSTDAKYLAPHFEKMLYDNAMLAICYAEFGFGGIARKTLDFCLRELYHEQAGAFWTALDADSEGKEGEYYLFTPGQVKDILGQTDGTRFCTLYDITGQGNFEGKNIPNLLKTGILFRQDEAFAAPCRDLLRQAREERPRPGRDEKITLGNNGLMLAALSTCGRLLHEPAYIDTAIRLADFIRDEMTS
ncbi:MAG: glycine--tRNA ligase subunit beta, partial [Desulfovibrionaceae bacterium]|nr:glycine--tRNA ligase subunit beta [Desulfovibrionaceae bacterium]